MLLMPLHKLCAEDSGKGLRLQAQQLGYLKEFEQWFNQHSE